MLVLFALLLVSLTLLSDATHNSERFGQMYSMLLLINAAGLVFLAALVIVNIIGLIRQQRMNVPGARMTSRLVVMFVVLAVVPVSVVYYFSLQFLQRGIDSWFDVRIEQGLDDALNLSRAALDVRLRGYIESDCSHGGRSVRFGTRNTVADTVRSSRQEWCGRVDPDRR